MIVAREVSFPAVQLVQAGPSDAAAMREIETWLSSRPDATPFHSPAWLSAVARGTGQEAFFLIALRKDGAICGLLPLNLIHSPWFGRALVSSGFAVDGGILADSKAVAAELAGAALALATRRACPTVELRGGMAPGAGWTHRQGTYLGFARGLQADDEAELLAIPSKHRAEVLKGLDRHFSFAVGRHQDFRDIHYALYCRSAHNLGTPVFPRALFDAVLDVFGDQADIAIVFDGDEPLSAVFSLYHRGACMPYWQGADSHARHVRADEAVYFRLMGHARARGCTTFDLGRSKAGTGAAAWKKSWGFEPQPLTYHVHAAPGHVPRDINPLSPRYSSQVALWKRLPPAVADRIGPWIARGLG
jgi:FemAB-related protein (PEP-CTERM system-associated)